MKAGDEAKFYLEGIVAGLPSIKDAGAEARLGEVIDLVNKMQNHPLLVRRFVANFRYL